jgi:hypothetical protein
VKCGVQYYEQGFFFGVIEGCLAVGRLSTFYQGCVGRLFSLMDA